MDNPNFFLAMNHLRKVFHQHLQEKKRFFVSSYTHYVAFRQKGRRRKKQLAGWRLGEVHTGDPSITTRPHISDVFSGVLAGITCPWWRHRYINQPYLLRQTWPEED
jgi:hypothetical protein